jgi:hypothetical protein
MLKTLTFQIGTDIIGQPIYHTHYISEIKDMNGVFVVVKSLTHR